MELFTDAHFWDGIAFVVFLAILVFAGVHSFDWKALGEAGDRVRAQLDEANRLREEAQALLASLKLQREETEKLAAEMMANAKAEAKRMEAEAKAKLEEQIKRRQELAERRISNAEAQAAAEVKAAAADLAAQIAEQVLKTRLADLKSDPLIDRAVANIGDRLQ